MLKGIKVSKNFVTGCLPGTFVSAIPISLRMHENSKNLFALEEIHKIFKNMSNACLYSILRFS